MDLAARRMTGASGARSLRCVMLTMIQYSDRALGSLNVTSDPLAIYDWEEAHIVVAPGHVAGYVLDGATLGMLCHEGVVDFSLSGPPCKDEGRLVLCPSHAEMFEEVIRHELARVMAVGEIEAIAPQLAGGRRGWGRDGDGGEARAAPKTDSGIGGRLTDGLENPDSNQPQLLFYPKDYYNSEGALPFCSRLPDNALGLKFQFLPIARMCVHTLMKVQEMQRQQRGGTNPRHVVAIYVYTYELDYEDGADQDQIYAAMNKAMRLRLEKVGGRRATPGCGSGETDARSFFCGVFFEADVGVVHGGRGFGLQPASPLVRWRVWVVLLCFGGAIDPNSSPILILVL